MAISRLVDKDPNTLVNEYFGKLNQKSLKLIQVFEAMSPKRDKKLMDLEYSDAILKVIREREEAKKKKEEESALAIEGDKTDDKKNE